MFSRVAFLLIGPFQDWSLWIFNYINRFSLNSCCNMHQSKTITFLVQSIRIGKSFWISTKNGIDSAILPPIRFLTGSVGKKDQLDFGIIKIGNGTIRTVEIITDFPENSYDIFKCSDHLDVLQILRVETTRHWEGDTLQIGSENQTRIRCPPFQRKDFYLQ